MKTRHNPKCTNSTAPNRRVSAASKSRGNYSEHDTTTPLMRHLCTVKLTSSNTAIVVPAPLAPSQLGEIPKG
jgi:hypothetical protein